MKRLYLFLTTAIILELSAGLAGGQTVKTIDSYVAHFADAGHFAGVVLAEKDGRIIYHKAFGPAEAENNVPNRLDTKFNVASVTKPMTSVILLKLIEAGKISPEDKLSKFIPDFPSGDKITILMLGMHRSGIPHRVMPEEMEALPHTAAEMVEEAKKAKLAFEPGTERLYSSAGYAVLARVLEIASGKTYDQLLQEYVFNPAGMKDSVEFDSDLIIKNRGRDYFLAPSGLIAAPLKDFSFLVGAGSVFSTAGDIYKFGRAAIDEKYGANAKLNLVRNGVFSSNGSTNGFRCNVRIDTEKKYGFVVVSNLASGANDLIIDSLPKILTGEEVAPPPVPEPTIIAKSPKKLTDYEGVYKLGGSQFTIYAREDQLSAGNFKLYPLGEDRFYNFWSYAEIKFMRDDKGRVTGLEWNGSAGKTVWTRE
ncbi:MAG: serine hydrolase [Pyrinomonadaceae bacterium]